MMSPNIPTLRCAIYTRKSTDEGLDQDFNSLDAQRDACEAYIASQAGLGWKLLSKRYDDGGISGGTLERPALKRLLNDIKDGLIDVVVVYKIDRLTRSLMDFAKIVDIFDNRGLDPNGRQDRNNNNPVSFVSVTQQFNTTSSMGRLTLNVLLSFAQFEREVTAERIRDKIAASKKKGMWMGGIVPLGYKVKDRKLIIHRQEAETVNYLFKRYKELGSVKKLSEEANSKGLVRPIRTQKNGALRKSAPFGRGNLYHLLSNPIYTGKIRYQGALYEGQHQAIIDDELWSAVQDKLADNRGKRCSKTNTQSGAILTGLVYDETGDRLSPIYATKNGVRYYYYISNRITHGRGKHKDAWRLPAKQLEQPVLGVLSDYLSNPSKLTELTSFDTLSVAEHETLLAGAKQLASDLTKSPASTQKQGLASFVNRIELHPDKLVVQIDTNGLKNLLLPTQMNTLVEKQLQPQDAISAKEPPNQQAPHREDYPATRPDIRQIEVSHSLQRRGVEAKLIIANPQAKTINQDPHLIKIIAKAHLWLKLLTDGSATSITDLAKQQNENPSDISRFLPLAFLAPNIIEQTLAGTQPADLSIQKLRDTAQLPLSWKEQQEKLGFTA